MVKVYQSEESKQECYMNAWENWRMKCIKDLDVICDFYFDDFRKKFDNEIHLERKFPRTGWISNILPNKWERVGKIYFLTDMKTVQIKGSATWVRKFASMLEQHSSHIETVVIDNTECK